MNAANPAPITGTRSVNQATGDYVVRKVRLFTGEHLPLLVLKSTGQPETYALRYTLAALRSPGLSHNTIELRLSGIGIGLSFLRRLGVDLVERIAQGLFLRTEELTLLTDRFLSRADGKGSVVGPYARDRYTAFIKYIGWRAEPLLHRATPADRRMLKHELNAFLKRAKSLQPKGSSGALAVERFGLSESQRTLLLDIIKPDSPRNPFRQGLRVRNYAMILLPYTLGMRSGELHGLWRSDYDDRRTPATLVIHRRPNDENDTRREPARTKTRARLLELEGEAQKALDAWLAQRSDRGLFPQARTHRFIFVNEAGGELTLRGARAVFERLRTAYPELANFCQHVLRHDVNERLVEQTSVRGWDPQEVRADAVYLMGWSETSKMPERYARSAIGKRATTRILEMQRRDHND